MNRIGMMTENVSKFLNMKDSLKLIKEMGYECADITFIGRKNKQLNKYFKGPKYLERAKELKEYANSINLPLVQAHAPFLSKLPSNKFQNNRRMNDLIRCIKACGVMGIKNLIIHPYNDYSNNINIEFYKELIPYAKEANVTICMENMWRWYKDLNKAKVCSCSLSDSYLDILNGVNDENIKACVDLGHAQMYSYMGLTPRKMIEELNKNVVCLHIHDNDSIHDLHLIPFLGTIDYEDVAMGLKNINYQGDLIAETCLPKDIKNIYQAKEFWKKQLYYMKKFQEMINQKK